MRLLLRQGLRHHVRHPLQTTLTLLGIAAGVALLTAMWLCQGTAERAFDRAVAAVAGEATHTVTGGPDGLPADAYAAVHAALGGRGVAPAVTAVVRVPRPQGRTVLRVLGIDPLADVDLRPWAGAGGGSDLPLGAFVTAPGAFVATPELLLRLGLAVGDPLAITVGGRSFTARCVGALAPPPAVAAGLADTLVVDVATAQEWTGRPDRIDRLDLRLVPGVLPRGLDVDAALALVRERCGPAARLEPAAAASGGLARLARGFRINLTALSLLSLLVGAFLVHETMRLSVVARRAGFGVLRALGASGRALGVVVGLEALLLGLCGSAAGALLGVLGAGALLGPVVRTLNDHYATIAIHAVEVDPWQLAMALGLGVAVTLAAGLGPAVAAAAVPPREVLVPPRDAARGGGWPWWWALPPAAIGVVLLLTVGDRLVQGYLGLLALLLAAVALMPALMTGCVGAAGVLLARRGPFARYVVRSTASARGHLALPLAAMVLAVATTIGLATLVSSFRDSVAGWLGSVLPGDVYVSVPGGVDEKDEPIADALVATLRAAPDVQDAVVYRRSRFWLTGGRGEGRIEVVAIAPTPTFVRAFPLLAGEREAFARGDGAWISEPLAFRWGLAIGDTLRVATAKGPEPLRIAAIYRDYSNERGEVLVGSGWLAGRAELPVTALGLELRPGADAEAVVAGLRQRAAAAGDQAVQVRSQRDLRTSSLEVFDRTFAITGALRLFCLCVAFFGIYAGFAALQLERGAEIGLLRCLGALPRDIATVVIGQTALLGVTAAVLAVPLGVGIGHLLAHVVNKISFGWSLAHVAVPWPAVADAAVLALVAALLAGVQPAWRFAHMQPAAALREA